MASSLIATLIAPLILINSAARDSAGAAANEAVVSSGAPAAFTALDALAGAKIHGQAGTATYVAKDPAADTTGAVAHSVIRVYISWGAVPRETDSQITDARQAVVRRARRSVE